MLTGNTAVRIYLNGTSLAKIAVKIIQLQSVSGKPANLFDLAIDSASINNTQRAVSASGA